MKTSVLELISERIIKLYKSIRDQEWDNPRIILICILCVVFPFVAWYYISTGLVLGLLKAISILWMLEKAPMFIKEIVVEYPLIADVVLNMMLLMLIGGYFGAGLTLGLGAIFSMIFISWSLPVFAEKVKREKERLEKEQRQYEKEEDFGPGHAARDGIL